MSTATISNGQPATAAPLSPPRAGPTRFPDVFGALARPFDPRRIKVRQQGGRNLEYVTARTVMNRLDTVLGPENWWDDYTPGENSVVCRLTIRLPDGQVITKSDAGGMAGMSDPGDDDKSGFSDAFKRAAVKFGVGRHLYGDGFPRYDQASPTASEPEVESMPSVPPEPAPAPTADPRKLHVSREYSEPVLPENDVRRWIKDEVTKRNDLWRNACLIDQIKYEPLANEFQVANGLITAWSAAGLLNEEEIKTNGKRDKHRVAQAIRQAWEDSPGEVRDDVRKYLKGKLIERAAEAGVELAEDEAPDEPDWAEGRE